MIYLLPVNACFIGAIDNLVVDIGEVAHKANFVAKVLEITIKSVKDDSGAGVPDMTIVIDGDSAYVHADLVCYKRNEFLFFPRQGVVDQ